MKKLIIVLLLLLLSGLPLVSAFADGTTPPEYVDNVIRDSHKVKNKWGLSGSFVAHPGYNWGGMAEGATWTYRFNVKEAMDGDASVGTLHFMTGDIDVVGQIKATSRNYGWGELAAVGTATYNDVTYYFMFLFVDYAVWFALSETPYDSYWSGGTIWGWSLRAYQLHSLNPGETFLLDYKVIHE